MPSPVVMSFNLYISTEKGYEEWEKYSSGDDEPIVERGLDEDEAFDFNVVPKLLDQEGSVYDLF